MKKILVVLLCGLTFGLVAMPAANASVLTYDLDFLSSGTHSVTGVLTTSSTLNAVGGYDVLGITGVVTGAGGGAITGLVTNPSQPYPSNCCTANGWYVTYDNVLKPAATQFLDTYGLVFNTGVNTWNLFGNSPRDYELFSSTEANTGLVDEHGTTTLTAVPEPGTMALLGIGMVGLGFTKRKSSIAATA